MKRKIKGMVITIATLGAISLVSVSYANETTPEAELYRMEAVLTSAINGELPVDSEAFNTMLDDNAPIEVTSISAPMVEPAFSVKNLGNGNMELVGTYDGKGSIYLGEEYGSVKIATKHSDKIVSGDSLRIYANGTLNGFRISRMEINGKAVYPLNPVKKVEKVKYGVFSLSGYYNGTYIKSEYGKVRLILDSKFANKDITIKVKGTIKSFKVLEAYENASGK